MDAFRRYAAWRCLEETSWSLGWSFRVVSEPEGPDRMAP